MIASPRVGKAPLAVEVQEAPGLSRVISAGGGTLGEALLAITFVPFLVYFMLTWKDHAHSATVRLFPKEHRLVAHRTVGRISAMIRSFIAGNVLIGLISAMVSAIVFWRLGLPYFYFLGVISGFASLVPYIGVFLALLPPLAGGIGIVSGRGVLVILLTVVGLHVHLEYSLSQDCWEALAIKPAGNNFVVTVLGVDLGRDGSDPGGADCGGHKDHL